MPTNEQPLQILLITARADLGGGPRHVLDLIRAFPSTEAQFSMAAPDQEPFAPQFRKLCANFIEIPARQFSLKAFVKLHRFIRSSRIEIIHSHGRGAGLYSRLLGLTTGRPVLHTFHGIHTAPGFKGRIKLFIDQMLAFLPFQAIVSSYAEAERARANYTLHKQPFFVIHNAVDLSRLPQESRPAKTTPLRVGAFLRDDSAKGPDLWLQLVKSAMSKYRRDELVFTCAGINKEELRKHGELPANLEVAGPLNDPLPWLTNIDIFVSTSRTEGLPLGVLEAMAAGVPCLLSNITGHQIFFENSRALAFAADRPDDFLDKLKLLSVAENRENQGKLANSWIKKQFSLTAFHDNLSDVYLELARLSSQGLRHTHGDFASSQTQ